MGLYLSLRTKVSISTDFRGLSHCPREEKAEFFHSVVAVGRIPVRDSSYSAAFRKAYDIGLTLTAYCIVLRILSPSLGILSYCIVSAYTRKRTYLEYYYYYYYLIVSALTRNIPKTGLANQRVSALTAECTEELGTSVVTTANI